MSHETSRNLQQRARAKRPATPLAKTGLVDVAISCRDPLQETVVMEPALASTDHAVAESTACWGAQLHGGAGCTPHFVPGKLHFKNNFCDSCRSCIMLPLAQVCALSAEQAAWFVNKRSKGFWNYAPASMGGGQYRIINNTAGCIGPRLAVFREQPPQLRWPALSRSIPQKQPYPDLLS